MRRRTIQMLVASFDYQQMPVGNTRVKMNDFIPKLLIQKVDQRICFFIGNMTGGMILQNFAFNTNQIAPKSQIIISQTHSNTGSFKNSTAFINRMNIVAQHRHVGNFTSRMHIRRNGHQSPGSANLCKLVNCRFLSQLQRSFSIIIAHWLIGHSIS